MLQLKTQHKQPQIHCPFCASWHKFGYYTKLSQANKSSFDLSTCESLVVLLKSVQFPSPPGKELGSAALSSLSCRTYTLYITRARAKSTSQGLHFAFRTRIFYLPSPLMPISMPAKRVFMPTSGNEERRFLWPSLPLNPSVTHAFHPTLCTASQ